MISCSRILFRMQAKRCSRFPLMPRACYTVDKTTTINSIYSCKDKDINGEVVNMSKFEGEILLIVNVASECGLTNVNYTQLPKLVDTYGKRGFRVLAFPCNQFASKEPGSHDEIIEFVKKFDEKMLEKIVFFEKGDVNGVNTREVYSFLKRRAPNYDDGTFDIDWNFVKFLVDHEGLPYERYNESDPDELKDDIETLLMIKEVAVRP